MKYNGHLGGYQRAMPDIRNSILESEHFHRVSLTERRWPERLAGTHWAFLMHNGIEKALQTSPLNLDEHRVVAKLYGDRVILHHFWVGLSALDHTFMSSWIGYRATAV